MKELQIKGCSENYEKLHRLHYGLALNGSYGSYVVLLKSQMSVQAT
jgi:hypothetical protein